MQGRPAATVRLTEPERSGLLEWLRRSTCTVAEQRRARIVLRAADGRGTADIAAELDIDANTVSRWRGRIGRSGIGEDIEQALADQPRSGRPPSIDALTRAQVVATACDPLPDGQGLSGWTLDLLVEELSLRDIAPVSRSSIHRMLSTADMQPHRQRMWLHSPDPQFREKVDEIVELYLHPPAGSVVLSYDEKTSVQAVERKHPDRPARPGHLARHEFEYIRHGTQSLLATLNVHSGEVIADCGPTRTGEDMECHFERVATSYPDVDLHVVLDNLNIHRGDRWKRFNERHGGRLHFHYTPLHASWVNQIELFFGVLGRRCLRRKSFRSTAELAAHMLAFVERWNRKDRKPFHWTFAGFDPTHTTASVDAQKAA